MNGRVVILGAGQAGGSAAALLRQHGYQGSVTLVGEEFEPPYQRPPLSKAWLKGQVSAGDLYMKPVSFYADKQIDLRLGRRALQVDPQQKRVHFDDDSYLEFDHLILACGARARHLSNVDTSLKGVHYLRSMAHASSLKETLASSRHLVIVGGGFIGLEVAASARALGVEVTVLEREPRLLSRLASQTVSSYLFELHRSQEVRILQNVELAAIEGSGTVQAVILSDGQRLECDTVLIGIGSIPNAELAQQSGLHCDQGVIVDDSALSSNPAVSAIGDMTRRPAIGAGSALVRLESVPSSLEQARQVALRLCGKPAAAQELPWFWSDQYSTKLQMAGLTIGSTRTVVRGNIQEGRFSVFHFAATTLVAAECINSPRDFMVARKAIVAAPEVDIEALESSQETLETVLA
ncbi:FAD-dependent oxidoreductase [Paenalcaligenes niemegkensis]|uniref:NAD(P)/FAD-dependent oxidoreductase n=1 Tax=Paenalcaligenes niemegkensis TaxID=2895469 RepID=UPI001EE7DE28|nr:FAD-dependent oxidoreductase [Paenalcaligenes niemegkensis]MCQ9616117.1 FAD-dependent oxidoreductase [Paenalcaligenes niemegkensis]